MEKANRRRSFECQICKQKLGHKSSLVRHIKKCERPSGPSLRQKACNKCAASKTRCDLRKPCCARCLKRGFSCEYISPSQEAVDAPTNDNQSEPFRDPSGSIPGEAPKSTHAQTSSINLQDEAMNSYTAYPSLDDFLYPHPDPLNRDECTSASTLPDIAPSGTGVFPTPECSGPDTPDESLLEQFDSFDGIHNQISLHMQPTTTPENALMNHSMEFLFRAFRSWPRMMAEGFQLPPLFHHSQTAQQNLPLPLANCFTLTKMWHGQCEGTSELIGETIQNEMKGLCAKYQSLDEVTRLAALQALVIYTIIILFPSRSAESSSPKSCPLFLKLDKFIHDVMATGLVLREERNHTRPPSWKAWVHVTCKRRAIVTLYLLYWSFAVYSDTPSRSCSLLGPIPACAPKFLWVATSAEEWEMLYNRWLVKWDEGCFLQAEIDNITPGVVMNRRAEMWLEEADEFGILILSIVNATCRERMKIE